jgi:hypothetical protein
MALRGRTDSTGRPARCRGKPRRRVGTCPDRRGSRGAQLRTRSASRPSYAPPGGRSTATVTFANARVPATCQPGPLTRSAQFGRSCLGASCRSWLWINTSARSTPKWSCGVPLTTGLATMIMLVIVLVQRHWSELLVFAMFVTSAAHTAWHAYKRRPAQ